MPECSTRSAAIVPVCVCVCFVHYPEPSLQTAAVVIGTGGVYHRSINAVVISVLSLSGAEAEQQQQRCAA